MEDKRFYYCNIKTINLLPAVLANQKAEEAGCDETIFHRGERVTECSHSNVHIIKDGKLKTAPCDELILPGITRAHILGICKREGIEVIEEPFTLSEMMEADEVFFSSSSALTCRVKEIDGVPVGMKDEATFARIRDGYQAEVRAECWNK
jgi:D-alanine transaminase